MRGETDDILKWPFHGTMVIHLMNQTEDDNHIEFAANYKSETLKEASVRVLAPKTDPEGLVNPESWHCPHLQILLLLPSSTW